MRKKPDAKDDELLQNRLELCFHYGFLKQQQNGDQYYSPTSELLSAYAHVRGYLTMADHLIRACYAVAGAMTREDLVDCVSLLSAPIFVEHFWGLLDKALDAAYDNVSEEEAGKIAAKLFEENEAHWAKEAKVRDDSLGSELNN